MNVKLSFQVVMTSAPKPKSNKSPAPESEDEQEGPGPRRTWPGRLGSVIGLLAAAANLVQHLPIVLF